MAFTYDITADRGKVRLAVGDTNVANPIWTDAEIDEALDEGGSVNAAIIWLLKALKGAMAVRGDVARVAALDEVLDARTDLPQLNVTMPAPLPMDAGFDPSDP